MEIGYFPVKHNWCEKYKREWKLGGLVEALLILPDFGGGEGYIQVLQPSNYSDLVQLKDKR